MKRRSRRAGESGQPVRVAMLHNIVSPHVVPLFEALAKRPGIALRVYFYSESDANRRWKVSPEGKFPYTILPSFGIRLRGKDLFTYFINPTIIAALRRDGFDVLISAGWDSFTAQIAFLYCALTRRPYIVWSGSTANEPSWRRTLSLPLVKLIIRGARGYIAYGTRAKEYLVTLGAPEERIAISFNTVDIEYFRAAHDAVRPAEIDALRAELGITTPRVVLYVGQLIERKGARTLIDAYARVKPALPDVGLILVGYGMEEESLRQYVAERGIADVAFGGAVDVFAMPRYYALADLFVLPSYEEVWGLVLNEAMACGLPVITTDRVGASVDVVREGENGAIVPAGDATALAAAIMNILDTPGRAEAMGAASRVLIERFRVAESVEGLARAIARLFPARAASAPSLERAE